MHFHISVNSQLNIVNKIVYGNYFLIYFKHILIAVCNLQNTNICLTVSST